MCALFYRSLRAIELALSARREYMTKEGQIIYGGPDHYARLAATKHLRDFLSAGRPAPKQPEKEERRRLTLPELEELLREDEAKKQAFNAHTKASLQLSSLSTRSALFRLERAFRVSYARERTLMPQRRRGFCGWQYLINAHPLFGQTSCLRVYSLLQSAI